MRSLKNLSLTLFLIGAMPMFGAIYMKIDGVKGDVTAAGHEKWIELQSVQMADGKPLPAAIEMGRVLVTSFQHSGHSGGSFVCQPNRPLGDVLVDIDGKRHVLRNARFAECPTLRNGVSTSVLAFGGSFRGGVKVAAGDVSGDGATQPNARLIGLGAAPIPIRLERLKLNPNGTSATMSLTKIGPGTLTLTATSPTSMLPKVVLELTNGTKWTFSQVTFTYTVNNTSSADSDSLPTETISMNYAKAEGPAAGYTAR